jgi:hypothetical protein
MAGIGAALTTGPRRTLIAGAILLLLAVSNGAWVPGLIAAGLLGGAAWVVYSRYTADRALQTPWPWPPDMRAAAEALARPIDPTPKRVLPAHEHTALVAGVATTRDELARLIADKPSAWPWALFTSVLLQRRQAVQERLRAVAGGYRPRAGMPQVPGRYYARIVSESLTAVVHITEQIDQFMLSPAFTGAFGAVGSGTADADAIIAAAHRVMDYQASLLTEAEKCVQTPVEGDVLTFVQDAGAITMLPLLSFDNLISTLCDRIAEAQDLLPYADGDIVLDTVFIRMEVPDGLSERIGAHMARFTR